jgi:hypothetical protein
MRETKWRKVKVLPGSGCRLGTAMESVTSRHGAKLGERLERKY